MLATAVCRKPKKNFKIGLLDPDPREFHLDQWPDTKPLPSPADPNKTSPTLFAHKPARIEALA